MSSKRSLAALSATLVLGALSARGEDPPKEEKRPLALRIREATRKATMAIAAHKPDDGQIGDARTLAALALLRGGGRDERKKARELLDAWWEDVTKESFSPTSNYELALYIQA